MIDRTHPLPITRQAQIVNISRGSVYYSSEPTSDADLKLMRRIDELHLELPFAGARMLRDLLRAEGFTAGRKHMTTLMRRMGITALYRKPNKRAPGNTIYPYLLRKLSITRSNHVWAMDSTMYLGGVANSFRRTRRGRHGLHVRPRATKLEPRTWCTSHRCISHRPTQPDPAESTYKSLESVQINGASSLQLDHARTRAKIRPGTADGLRRHLGARHQPDGRRVRAQKGRAMQEGQNVLRRPVRTGCGTPMRVTRSRQACRSRLRSRTWGMRRSRRQRSM